MIGCARGTNSAAGQETSRELLSAVRAALPEVEVREAHVSHESTVVLASAGASDERAHADIAAAAELLRRTWAGPVRVAYAAGHEPSVADAVRAAHAYGEDGTVAIAPYLLASGVFQTRLNEAGADVVTRALSPHPDIVSIVIDRYSSFTHD